MLGTKPLSCAHQPGEILDFLFYDTICNLELLSYSDNPHWACEICPHGARNTQWKFVSLVRARIR